MIMRYQGNFSFRNLHSKHLILSSRDSRRPNIKPNKEHETTTRHALKF